jgi:hypothetical protein
VLQIAFLDPAPGVPDVYLHRARLPLRGGPRSAAAARRPHWPWRPPRSARDSGSPAGAGWHPRAPAQSLSQPQVRSRPRPAPGLRP